MHCRSEPPWLVAALERPSRHRLAAPIWRLPRREAGLLTARYPSWPVRSGPSGISPRSGATSPLGECRRLAHVQAMIGSVGIEVVAKLGVSGQQIFVLLVEGGDESAEVLHHDVGNSRTG